MHLRRVARQPPERASQTRSSRDTVHATSSGESRSQRSSTTPAPWAHVWRSVNEFRSQIASLPSIAPDAASGSGWQKPAASTDASCDAKCASSRPLSAWPRRSVPSTAP